MDLHPPSLEIYVHTTCFPGFHDIAFTEEDFISMRTSHIITHRATQHYAVSGLCPITQKLFHTLVQTAIRSYYAISFSCQNLHLISQSNNSLVAQLGTRPNYRPPPLRSALRGKFYFPSSSRSRADVSRLLPECLRVSDRASRVPSLSIEPCIMILIVVVVNLTKKLIFGSTGGKLSDL